MSFVGLGFKGKVGNSEIHDLPKIHFKLVSFGNVFEYNWMDSFRKDDVWNEQ